MTPTEQREHDSAIRWIAGPNVGMSSKTIWCVMMGVKCDDPYTPLDPDDFGRCWVLLSIIPGWRLRLPEVAKKHWEWTGLVREWDTLTEMYETVIANDGWNAHASKVMYDFMQPLLDEGKREAGWIQDGPGCWHKGKRSVVRIGP